MNETAKHWLDGVAVSAAIATFFAWLPPMAALASLIWTLIRIYESDTAQRLIKYLSDKREVK